MTPIDPESVDPIIDPASEPSPEGGADSAPAAAAVPAEDEPIEEVLWRFVEENGWLPKPRPPLPPRPPEPKSIHQMTPEEMHESLPVHLRRQRPDGTYYAMGLISRMQQDLEDLTQGKRAATYPEVDEYLGYALLAEGLAPRELSAPDAVKWWRAGGSEVLRERPDRDVPTGGEPSRLMAQTDDAPVEIGDARGLGGGPSAPQFQPAVAVRLSPQFGDSEGLVTDGDARWPGDRAAAPASLTQISSPGRVGGKPLGAVNGAVSRGLAEPRPATVQTPNPDSAKKEKERAPAPPGTNLSTYDTGFGGPGRGINGDYRTTAEERAWLAEVRPTAIQVKPYPDGIPGNEKATVWARRKIRREVGYYYTLPEVKALLDVFAHTEGTEIDGYYRTHDPDKQRLPDLKRFYGTVPIGRYQITADNWKNFGEGWWSRKEFSEISQDMVAITLMRQKDVIKELLKGNLSGAFSKAAEIFASIPLSSEQDYSGFVDANFDRTYNPATQGKRQGTPVPFNDLLPLFVERLNARRKEFKEAEQAWKTKKELPKAFISPLQWRAFGLDGF